MQEVGCVVPVRRHDFSCKNNPAEEGAKIGLDGVDRGIDRRLVADVERVGLGLAASGLNGVHGLLRLVALEVDGGDYRAARREVLSHPAAHAAARTSNAYDLAVKPLSAHA